MEGAPEKTAITIVDEKLLPTEIKAEDDRGLYAIVGGAFQPVNWTRF